MRRWVGLVEVSLAIGWSALGCSSSSVGSDGSAGGQSGSNGAAGAAAGGHGGGGGAQAGGSGGASGAAAGGASGAQAGGASGAAGGSSGAGGANFPSHCSNGTVDQQETDVDCGGACPGCGENKTCATDQDCAIPFNCNPADYTCEI